MCGVARTFIDSSDTGNEESIKRGFDNEAGTK